MKNIIFVLVAIISLQLSAQKNNGNKHHNKKLPKLSNLSIEDIADLQTKKMTLHLDLNKSQQEEIKKINLENAKMRKSMMEMRKAKKENGDSQILTQEERLKMIHAKLDHKIALKAKMKKVLNEEQYAKWQESQTKRNRKKRVLKKRKPNGKHGQNDRKARKSGHGR